jgi:hypothetical protein
VAEPGERPLDPLAFSAQKLTRMFRIHDSRS